MSNTLKTPQSDKKRVLSVNDKARIRARIAEAGDEKETIRFRAILANYYGVSIRVISGITSKSNMGRHFLKNKICQKAEKILDDSQETNKLIKSQS